MNFAFVLRRIPLFALCLLAHSQVGAQVANMTQGELALTPDFCQDVQSVNGWSQHSRPSPRSPHWVSLMGETFWGMHHYCWAQIHLQRANRVGTTPQTREFLIREAIADYYFVIKVAPADFVLLPELYYRTGDAFLLLGDFASALGEFAKSRKVKSDYWPSYLGEAKLLTKVGKKKEALELLEQGLTLMPNEPNLVAAVKDQRTPRPKLSLPAQK